MRDRRMFKGFYVLVTSVELCSVPKWAHQHVTRWRHAWWTTHFETSSKLDRTVFQVCPGKAMHNTPYPKPTQVNESNRLRRWDNHIEGTRQTIPVP